MRVRERPGSHQPCSEFVTHTRGLKRGKSGPHSGVMGCDLFVFVRRKKEK